jgi:hypothetical protein
MTPAAMLLLAIQAPVFAFWAFLMFRNLFRLRRRAVARSGSPVPGPGATLESFGAFLKLPEYRRDRRLLGAVTLLMFVLIGLHALLAR